MSTYFVINRPGSRDEAFLREGCAGLEARLRSKGVSEADTPELANILLYCHKYPEIEVSAAEVAALPVPDSVRLVLLVRPLASANLADRNLKALGDHSCLHVLPVDPAPGVLTDVDRALDRLAKRDSCACSRSPSPRLAAATFRDLLESTVGLKVMAPEDLSIPLKWCLGYKGLGSSAKLQEDLVARFRLFLSDAEAHQLALHETLLLLTRDDSAARHNLRGRMDRPFDGSDGSEAGSRWSARRLLEFLGDLRDSLIAPQSVPLDPRILVFDDHPDKRLQAMFTSVATAFFSGAPTLRFVDPTETRTDDSESILSYLASYRTLGARVEPHSLTEIFQTSKEEFPDFILVDQFFRTPGSEHGKVLGPDLIRGLMRWLRDSLATRFKGRRLPEVIAVSRTDEPSVIQAALRAGARDYVLKSRVVALPAVLARVARGTSDPAVSLHRSFSELYGLPNETIGLLQAARIPRIAFHIDDEGADHGSPEWSELLTWLPKADLHVHAGSVMSREFLALASGVMLARHPVDSDGPSLSCAILLAGVFNKILDSHPVMPRVVPSSLGPFGGPELEPGETAGSHEDPGEWFVAWSRNAKRKLTRRLLAGRLSDPAYRQFRATLHSELAIPDYANGREAVRHLVAKNDLELALYLFRHASELRWFDADGHCVVVSIHVRGWRNDDLIRLYLLVLASRCAAAQFSIGIAAPDEAAGSAFSSVDILNAFRSASPEAPPVGEAYKVAWDLLGRLHGRLLDSAAAPVVSEADPWEASTCAAFRGRGWSRPEVFPPVKVTIPVREHQPEDTKPLRFSEDPIGFSLATGTRCTNLADYLLGCEFSGAEHLQHPFLVHVYARQTVLGFMRQGVFYAELKASPDGYLNSKIGFEYNCVVQCLVQAFSEAQSEVLSVHRGGSWPIVSTSRALGAWSWAGYLLGSQVAHPVCEAGGATNAGPSRTANVEHSLADARWFPCKVSLVFVGKRHKKMREMILEAAGAAVMRPAGETPAASASAFVSEEFIRCRVVGFDLAGQEVGYPPSQYAPEFGRLSRLHVPITVHAGENAPPQYIEDAILELGASRIGHGLSLAEDRRLMARLRDDRIAVELCPVCNHQTSQFHSPGPSGRRPYPLRDFFRAGLYVTINTDNPIISNTSMVREFYQASWAWDDRADGKEPEGLPLWEALRIIRMGFVCCFLNLSERRHMLELVGQYLFDLFSDESVVRQLRLFAEVPPTR
jgi:CheY-like chemotaxis protein